MNNQHYSQKPESESPPLPIVDLIILTVLAIATIIFSAIVTSKNFGAYKYPIRSLLDVLSVIAVFEVLIWISKLFSRKKRTPKRGASSDYKSLKALCIIIAVIGLLNAPMFFFDVGSTQIGSFFERRTYTEQYIVDTSDGSATATISRTISSYGYNYKLIAIGGLPFDGDTLIPNEPVYAKSASGKSSYYVTLTDKRAK